ncbi:Adaptive-response sensory-kinase SasA [subsurface metagenome]
MIFNNFTKIDESDSSHEGLGLGLSLSKKLVELMNGNIWYESKEMKGTTFYFTIPYKPLVIKNNSKTKEVQNSKNHAIKQKIRNSVAL